MNKKAFIKKFIVVLLFVLSLSISLYYLNQFHKTKKKTEIKKAVQPVATPLPAASFENQPSAYATDEAVLKIEKGVNDLEKELNSVDLEEKSLYLPTLDLNVKY